MKKEICRFCENPESILSRDICFSGCSKIANPYPFPPRDIKREDCENGIHSKQGFGECGDEWKCDYCNVIIRRCGALNSMET